MQRRLKNNMKNKILPIMTAVIVIIAIGIVIFIPKNKEKQEAKTDENKVDNAVTQSNTSNSKSAKKVNATLDENGDVEIKADDLDSSNATFINYKTANDYVIELIAVKDSSDNINVAFNTCQVCNGAPRAYFVQTNGELVCQNCGNVFSLDSVGQYAYGCNPMTLEDNDIIKSKTGITISKEFLTQNEKLFANVAEH